MVVARAAVDWACASAVGLFPGPPYLSVMKQWAAVSTHCGLMSDPPQTCTVPVMLGSWMLMIQGQGPWLGIGATHDA